MVRKFVFFSLFLLISCTSPSSSGDPSNPPENPAVQDVFLNERVQLLFQSSSGLPSLTLNGNKVDDADFNAGSVFFDVSLKALGGNFIETADAVVFISGKEVLRQPLHISQNTLASSDVVLFTQGFTRSELESEIAGLNSSLGIEDGFNLKPDSFTRVDDSQTGVAVVDIGQQKSEAALKSLSDLSTSLRLAQAGKSFTASPNMLYGVSMRARYWSSPRCEILDDLAEVADDGWKLLRNTDLLSLLNVDEAHEAKFLGGDTAITILDTGINEGDTFDCPETPYRDGHGTHIFNLANLTAPDATVVSEFACGFDGFCSTAEIAQALIDLEQRILTSKQNIVVNLSLSGALGVNDAYDRAIWAQLRDYESRYPNFLAVAAAGNNGISNEAGVAQSAAYPASFSDAVPQFEGFISLKNILSVGAVGVDLATGKVKASALNPQGVPVDILAPGMRVCLENENGNCLPDNREFGLTGSSFSTALVSGVAALMWSECPDLTAQELRQLIKAQGLVVEGSAYKMVNADPSFLTNGLLEGKCAASPIDDPERLEAGTERIASLLDGQRVEYKFTGFFNTPIFLSMAPKGDVDMMLSVFDSRGIELYDTWPSTCDQRDGVCKYVFTPQMDGEYVVQYRSYSGVGEFTAYNDYAAGPPSERNLLKSISLETRYSGVLAVNAFDEYLLSGFQNRALIVKPQFESEVMNIDILNFLDEKVLSEKLEASKDILINLKDSRDYKIRVYTDGYRDYGKYSFFLIESE